MEAHVYRRLLAELAYLTPAQIEGAATRLRDIRRRSEVLAELEARTEQERHCPFCGGIDRQKWGKTHTQVQRYRCGGCRRTWSGRTGSAFGRIHRPDLFLAVVRDMLGEDRPASIRKLAARLGLDKNTIWRWRFLIHRVCASASDRAFAGVVEADEAFQRESRKGSREWVRRCRDPALWPAPPRLRWQDYRQNGILMLRGLSRWQLPILTLMDRGRARRLERLPDRRDRTIVGALAPVMRGGPGFSTSLPPC